MNKILLFPNSEKIEKYFPYVDAFLYGIKGYSVNTPYDVSIEKIKNISSLLKKNNKELFVSLNKNMINNDIDELKDILIYLDTLDIKGIFYADICFINLKKKLDIKTDLVWSNEHLTTNYATINFFKKYKVSYTYLSGEITKEEIRDIKDNTTIKLIVPTFGYLPMFVSFRHAIKNYLEYFKLKDNSKINYLEKEGSIYPIIDNELGTFVYSANILDGYDDLKDLDIDYMAFNSFLISEDDMLEVLKIVNKKSNKKIDSLFKNVDKGFLYKETIYRVKK